MEENNDVFLVDGDVLVYLVEPMHKKYSITFAWGYPFSAYVSYNRFFNPLPLYTIWMSPSIPPVAYVLKGWPISQPKNK